MSREEDYPDPEPSKDDPASPQPAVPLVPSSLALTIAARGLQNELIAKFGHSLDLHARAKAAARKATVVDAEDFQVVHDKLLTTRSRPAWLNAVADLGIYISGCFSSYAVNLMTSSEPSRPMIAVTLVAASFVVLASIVVKNIRVA